MSKIPTLPGVTSEMVVTPRLTIHTLFSGPADGEPIIFLHGNFSAATYWEETMLALPGRFRAIAPDLRGYGQTEAKPVDATRGARDWADDLKALSDALGDKPGHLVGWSMGAAAAMQFALDYPELTASLIFVSPVSPYGFGGTKGVEGAPCHDDFAGSGGGVVSPDFVRLIQAGDRSANEPNSPRNVINGFYYKAPFQAAREEAFLEASLLQQTGEQAYPGDLTPSPNWPNAAPGVWGPINAGSPKYFNAAAIAEMDRKPPILWIRGDADQIVSDNSFFDLGTLGQMGFVPGWPGAELYPPQPMVSQMRAVLERYAANNGRYQEVVLTDVGHSPHIERPDEFMAALRDFLETLNTQEGV